MADQEKALGDIRIIYILKYNISCSNTTKTGLPLRRHTFTHPSIPSHSLTPTLDLPGPTPTTAKNLQKGGIRTFARTPRSVKIPEAYGLDG